MNLKAWEQELAAVMPFVLQGARRDLRRHPGGGRRRAMDPGLPGKSVAGRWGFPPSALRAPAG